MYLNKPANVEPASCDNWLYLAILPTSLPAKNLDMLAPILSSIGLTIAVIPLPIALTNWVLGLDKRALIHISFNTSQVLFLETKSKICLVTSGLSKSVNFCINFSLEPLISLPAIKPNSSYSLIALSKLSDTNLLSANSFLTIPKVLKLPPVIEP